MSNSEIQTLINWATRAVGKEGTEVLLSLQIITVRIFMQPLTMGMENKLSIKMSANEAFRLNSAVANT